MSVQRQIEQKLREAFAPDCLEVIDESEQHRGHAGFREGGETHFRVEIRAEAFANLSRVARHRAINEVLKAELDGPVHALSLAVESP